MSKPPRFTADEYNLYVNWALYMVLGDMNSADGIYATRGGAVRRCAKKLRKHLGVPLRSLWRGVLTPPGLVGPDRRLPPDPDRLTASFTEDKDVACWFADIGTTMSSVLAQLAPNAEGWVVETFPKKDDVLFHWSWADRFPAPRGGGTTTLAALASDHQEMIPRMDEVQWNLGSQKEVILKRPKRSLMATPIAEAACPPTGDLDRRLTVHRLRRNPPRALAKLRKAVGPSQECYPAAEALYHNVGGYEAGLTPMQQRHEGRSHWWVQGPKGQAWDPAAAQFRTPVPYERGRGRGFLTKRPSRRARKLAKSAGVKLNPDDYPDFLASIPWDKQQELDRMPPQQAQRVRQGWWNWWCQRGRKIRGAMQGSMFSDWKEGPWASNPDPHRRELEREAAAGGDVHSRARLLMAKVRAGEVPMAHVSLASVWAGRPCARLLDPPPYDHQYLLADRRAFAIWVVTLVRRLPRVAERSAATLRVVQAWIDGGPKPRPPHISNTEVVANGIRIIRARTNGALHKYVKAVIHGYATDVYQALHSDPVGQETSPAWNYPGVITPGSHGGMRINMNKLRPAAERDAAQTLGRILLRET